MEVLPILLSVYLSTWIMIMFRTFGLIAYILEDRKEKLMTDWKVLHFLVYAVGTVPLVPFIWQIAFSEGKRKTWVLTYCEAVTNKINR